MNNHRQTIKLVRYIGETPRINHTHYVKCDCGDPYCSIAVSWFDREKGDHPHEPVYIHAPLNPYLGFFSRVWVAIRYVFLYGRGDIHHSEVVATPNEVASFVDALCEAIGVRIVTVEKMDDRWGES